MWKIYKSLFLLCILFLFYGISYAQSTGDIEGRIIEDGTEEPLFGANALLLGSSKGAAADINGAFKIRKITPGTYTIRISYLGYSTIEREIVISAGETAEVTYELQWAGVEGEEINISAQAEGQVNAINEQLAETGLINVVSKDRIRALPEANAAEAVGRLPGISIKRSSGEGDEIVVRGVQPKFNLVTVNGIRMPSTNENNSAVGLAGISQYMIDGITVRKSQRAEDDADVVGGAVDLKLATAPKGFRGGTILEGMYNGLTDNPGSYRTSIHASDRFLNNKLGIIGQLNLEKADRTNHALSAGFSRDTRTTDNRGVALTNANFQKNKITRDRLGATLLVDYELPEGIIRVSSMYNKFTEDRWERNSVFSVSSGAVGLNKDMRVVYGDNYTLVNGLNLETEIFGGALLDIGTSYTSGRREGDTKAMGFWYEGSGAEPVAAEFYQNPYGKIAYNIIPFMQDTATNYNISRLYKEDVDFTENEFTFQSNLKIPFVLSNNLTGAFKFGGKLRLKNRDYDYNYDGDSGGIYGGDVNILRQIINDNPEINWPWTWSNRPDSENALPAYPLYGNVDERILEGRVGVDNFAQRKWVEQIVDRAEASNWANLPVWYQPRAQDLANDYNGEEELYAGYLMTEFNWKKKVLLNVGLRYENEITNYSGYGVENTLTANDNLDTLNTVERTNEYYLPSATLQYNYSDWGDVRLAYSKSLARPEYYAFIPHYEADLRQSFTGSVGNTQLDPAVSSNYDLIFSIYSNYIGLFTVSGFYKEIEKFFYQANFQVIDESADNEMHDYNFKVPKGEYINVWRNLDRTSYLKGIEFSWQTHLWYLPTPLSGIVLSANYSKIDSKAYYYTPYKVTERVGPNPWDIAEVRVDSFVTTKLIDQPNDVINLSVGYDYKDFSIRFAYNFQGKTLAYKTNFPETDGYSHDYTRLDLSIRQKLPIDKLSVQLLLSNITNEAEKSYTFKERYNNNEQLYGFTGSLGVRYEF